MTPPAEDDRPLPAARAFVVQLRREAEVTDGRLIGRVTHVVSGRTGDFETLPELLGFIERLLAGGGTARPLDLPEEP